MFVMTNMNNREAALEFVRSFCAGDVDALAPLLTEDLRFSGPFYQFSSAGEYLDVLKSGPLEPSGYRLISVTDSGDSVSVYYDYEQRDATITIAQLFTFRDQKISEILLVFDGRGFD